MRQGPDYLKNYISTKEISKIEVENKKWFDTCDWKAKIQLPNGIDKFKILFYGQTIDNSIVNFDGEPLIIYLLPVDNSEKILLFDSRKHGYEALLIEKFPIEENIFICNFFLDKDNCDLFEIVVWTNYNMDFQDEYAGEQNILLSDGTLASMDYIERNAFDSFGIIVKNEHGNVYEVFEIELN